MINLNVYCDTCRIPYQIGLIQFIKSMGCPICHNNKFKFAFGEKLK